MLEKKKKSKAFIFQEPCKRIVKQKKNFLYLSIYTFHLLVHELQIRVKLFVVVFTLWNERYFERKLSSFSRQLFGK